MTDDRPLRVETQGRVGLITLHRPQQLNALNDALMDALGAALKSFDADPGIGAIVITGSEKAFAAGADIEAMADWTFMDVTQGQFITRNWETIRSVRKPVIAAVAGYAMGAGGTQRLPRAIGKAKAMDMCLSARMLDAQEADRYGLVSRVVPDAELLERSLALATQIAAFSLPALVAIKESVNRAWESPLTEGILFERRALYGRFASSDAHEGMHAFLDKRKPAFAHR